MPRRLGDRQPGGVHREPELRVAHVEQQQCLLAVVLAAQAQGERGLLQLRGLGAGAHQPGVTAAEGDQPLVQPVVAPAVGRQVRGRGGERGPDRVVAALTLLLEPAQALLVAVVDARHAADAHQHRQGVPEVPVVVKLRGQPGHVVVADERLRQPPVVKRAEEGVMTAERVVKLVEVPVVERGPDGLPRLVLRDRVEPRLVRVGGVVAVDHLAEEPGVRERLAHRLHRLGPERRRHRVRGVKPPPARAPAEPVGHHLDHVGEHGGLVVVELDQLAVALEDRVVRAVGRPLEPAGRRRSRPAVFRRLEGGERAAHVVEHPVEHQPHAAPAGGGDQGVEVALVAKPRVDAEVVDGVVAVRLRGEHRPEQQPVAAELDRVVNPRLQPPQPVAGRLAARQRRPLRAGEAERVDLPQHGVISPGRHPITLPAPLRHRSRSRRE